MTLDIHQGFARVNKDPRDTHNQFSFDEKENPSKISLNFYSTMLSLLFQGNSVEALFTRYVKRASIVCATF